ncbi:hypothetical protein J4E81_008091 [Alternaria sp. BMP 2799]|nr:hypothetical protein J4E81_008091 [Alternaria sp. BMP 2799]
MLEFFGDFNMESDEDQPRKSGSSRAPSREFDPDTAGFGKFFVYAACYWTEHFKDCAPNALPEGDDIAKLARRGSPTLRNWAETYKRPNLTLSSQRDLDVEDFDELIVATTFGSEAFLSTFLERKFEKDRIRDKSPREAVKRLMRSGNLNAVKIMLQNESLQYTFRDGLFLYQIIDMCQDATHTESANPQKWNELLSILVCDFFSSGDAPFHWANTFLCSAARQGCLPMIKILFTKASKEPDLAKALVAETHTDSPYQSVGEAAFWGHADIVQYLLTQKHVDITSHLYHRTTRDRRNVLHWAALSKKDATILRILAERLPSGVEEQSTEGDTPLQLLTFGHHASIEAVLALVDVGKADVNSSPGGTYCSPLRNAIRAKNVEACRLLVSYGAHVDDALQRDEASRKIVLADNLEDAEASQRILDILVPPR